MFKIKTNFIQGVDIRNDGGCVTAPPTKYKRVNGKPAKYIFVIGDMLEMPKFLFNLLTPNKKQEKGIKEDRKEFNVEIKKRNNFVIKLY